MKHKSVRISEIAKEFNLETPLVEKLLVASWGNFVTLRRVLNYFKQSRVTDHRMLEMCKDCAKRLRETWVQGQTVFVDTLTLRGISTIASNAGEADKILEIILADED